MAQTLSYIFSLPVRNAQQDDLLKAIWEYRSDRGSFLQCAPDPSRPATSILASMNSPMAPGMREEHQNCNPYRRFMYAIFRVRAAYGIRTCLRVLMHKAAAVGMMLGPCCQKVSRRSRSRESVSRDTGAHARQKRRPRSLVQEQEHVGYSRI